MGKLIFYLMVAIIIYWIIKSRQPGQKQTGTPPESIEDMVSCAHCGVHLPKSEAISSHDQYFCCSEHDKQSVDSSS